MERRLLLFAESARFNAADYDMLSKAERAARCVWELEAEVNNGGFTQFFQNSSGEHAPDTPDTLRRIGAYAAADIVDAALVLVGKK